MLSVLLFAATFTLTEPHVLSPESDRMFCPAAFDYIKQLRKNHLHMMFYIRTCQERSEESYVIYVAATRHEKEEYVYLLKARKESAIWNIKDKFPLYSIKNGKSNWIGHSIKQCSRKHYSQGRPPFP